MSWKRSGSLIQKMGSDRVTQLFADPNETNKLVHITGPEAAVKELVDLVERGQEDRERRQQVLAGQNIWYWVVIYLGQGNIGAMPVQVAPPGIRHAGEVLDLQVQIANALKQPVIIMSYTELPDPPPSVTLEQALPSSIPAIKT